MKNAVRKIMLVNFGLSLRVWWWIYVDYFKFNYMVVIELKI